MKMYVCFFDSPFGTMFAIIGASSQDKARELTKEIFNCISVTSVETVNDVMIPIIIENEKTPKYKSRQILY